MRFLAVFSGGGTLGPVTPLLAVAEELRMLRPDAEAHWVGTADGPERRLVEGADIAFHAIASGKMRRYLSIRNFSDKFRIVAGFFQSLALLRRLRPDAVVSAGGYVAVPLVWAAWLSRVPVHVHQQDVRPGLANRLTAPFARTISVAFEKSVGDFGRRAAWTGNPVRAMLFSGDAERARALFGLDPAVPTVLALGGGTGAAGLNALVSGAKEAITARANLLHLTGEKKGDPMASGRYKRMPFLGEDISHAYAAADIVITRAGMGTLTELAALGKPAVIVPMPGSHQEDNAAFFTEAGAAVTVDERDATPGALADAVLLLLSDDGRRAGMKEAMRGLAKSGAARRVAETVLGL